MDLKEKTKVMITGCGGMLGKAVYARFTRDCTVHASDINDHEPWLKYLDVRDFDSLLKTARSYNPDLIINLAALTDLEYCECNPENTWLTNGFGQENICLTAQKTGAVVVYISTAGIFDGKKDAYNDFDMPNPLSIYGKAKHYGEKVTRHMLSEYFIFRPGWMMGGGPEIDKKFINKIFKQIRAGEKEFFVVDDKLGTPTYTSDFASSMFEVIRTGYFELYNMVCEGSASRADVAREFVRCLGLEKRIKITVVSSDYFKQEYFAPRPYSKKLINLKLKKRGLMFMRSWKECLAEYTQEFKEQLTS